MVGDTVTEQDDTKRARNAVLRVKGAALAYFEMKGAHFSPPREVPRDSLSLVGLPEDVSEKDLRELQAGYTAFQRQEFAVDDADLRREIEAVFWRRR